MFNLNKRGVSPLIATVLLIAFAVSLGAVIMNLGVNLTSKCDTVQLEIHAVGDNTRLCFDQVSNQLRFTINNKGSSVDGYKIIATGDSSDIEEYFVPLEEFEKSPGILTTTGTRVDDVSLIPYLDEKGRIRICSEQVREYTNVGLC